jgi:hypothetical protein
VHTLSLVEALRLAAGTQLVLLAPLVWREQEYRVRQLINTELGFRNFNAFLTTSASRRPAPRSGPARSA